MSVSTLSPPENTCATRKRFASMSDDENTPISNKKQCISWYVTLESEESLLCASSDTESVYSLQGKETEIAKDTSDTSDYSSADEYSVEYDPVSLSEDGAAEEGSSSGTDDDMVATAAAISAAICAAAEKDSWVTDGEDNSESDDLDVSVDVSVLKPGYGRCIQCKTLNQNPLFRFCEKCFQRSCCWQCKMPKKFTCLPLCNACFKIRKTFFPPRPRAHRQRTVTKPATTTTLTITQIDPSQGCIPSSQDSGICSQDLPMNFGFDEIKVPGSKFKSSVGGSEMSTSTSSLLLSDGAQSETQEKTDRIVSNSSSTHSSSVPTFSYPLPVNNKSERRYIAAKDDCCIICTNKPKNGIFVHGTKGHICACYTCAVKIYNKNRRCPVCNCKIKNVLKAFTL